MKPWLSQHRQAFRLVLSRMWSTPLATLMMLGALGVSLSLPAGLYVVLDNVAKLAGSIESDPQISLFLTLDASPDIIRDIDQRLRNHPGIKNYRFVGRATAWAELQQSAGLEELAGGLEKNPLPDAYIVHADHNDPAMVDQLRKELQQWRGVELAQLDAAWVKRLYALLQIGRQAVLILAGLLGLALLAVIGNTIRLQILTQREEIEVSQLIGATDAFIRRPFLYAGVLYGVGGGMAAWLILYCALSLFNLSIDELARLYASDFRLHMPDIRVSLILIGTAALLGWTGSYWAVNRYLARINDRLR
ncbi:cell division protein FtsX [mine drainage metagenome]|uniref:Cell division protein FtsX n=1 Tax=mine drainage metagenome TaxID=410659 RepID=A0A1J5QC18_9ZZZZ